VTRRRPAAFATRSNRFRIASVIRLAVFVCSAASAGFGAAPAPLRHRGWLSMWPRGLAENGSSCGEDDGSVWSLS